MITFSRHYFANIGFACALFLPLGLANAQPAPAQAQSNSARVTGSRANRSWSNDPRVQSRTYLLEETGEQIPYAVFVSSKVSKDKKSPLVVALRGYNGNPGVFMHGAALTQAEEGGYILVGPMGYNSIGGYGMTMPSGRMGGPGRSGATNAAAPTGPSNQAATRGPLSGRASQTPVGGTAETNVARMSELSEKDVLTVLEIVRKEFNVDERRTYLMGHSQGGGGALRIAEKYPTNWAGVALLAPGVFGFQATEQSNVKNIPLYVTVGANDSLIASVRRLDEQLISVHVAHEYKEAPGLDHGGIIMGSMPDVFKFFSQHVKPESK
jgi:dienelactone hydrolase